MLDNKFLNTTTFSFGIDTLDSCPLRYPNLGSSVWLAQGYHLLIQPLQRVLLLGLSMWEVKAEKDSTRKYWISSIARNLLSFFVYVLPHFSRDLQLFPSMYWRMSVVYYWVCVWSRLTALSTRTLPWPAKVTDCRRTFEASIMLEPVGKQALRTCTEGPIFWVKYCQPKSFGSMQCNPIVSLYQIWMNDSRLALKAASRWGVEQDV